MPEYKFVCPYCGNTWKDTYYAKYLVDTTKCPVCKHPKVKNELIDNETNDVYGYSFSPPFTKK